MYFAIEKWSSKRVIMWGDVYMTSDTLLNKYINMIKTICIYSIQCVIPYWSLLNIDKIHKEDNLFQ